ncbi:dolichyl-diphosphooligosaccharide-protein glycosyltransferase subunit dad1, partial [Dunaliella salina]
LCVAAQLPMYADIAMKIVLPECLQLVYMLLVGTFPFNGFLAGFLSSLGFFTLTGCLRLQIDPANSKEMSVSPERAFADYCFANLVLHLTVWNYIG